MPKKRKPAETFDEHVGDAIERVMNDARLTQAELATKAGMPMTNLGRSIRGTRPLSVNEFERLCGAVGVPASDLLDNALSRFGGIDKLLGEHVSPATPTLVALPPFGTPESDEEHEAAMEQVWEQMGDEDDERTFRETHRNAAHAVDPELAQDEPAHP